jgi:hydroxymethylbilane synthase
VLQAQRIRIGTRGSPLALAQANEVKERLIKAHGYDPDLVAIVVIKTTGDQILDRPLSEAGGKGLFTKEIEEALLSHDIDLAVHSMKDMQTVLPEGLLVGAVLEREDVRDAFISLKYRSMEELPEGAVVGTSSLRREAQIRYLRPDLKVVGFRGNVQTRLRKLEEGMAEATFLASAGLNRLGLTNRISSLIPTEKMLPAVAQGAIAIEIRVDDEATAALISPLNHEPTAICVTAERAYLARLQGSCRTPIAGLATAAAGEIMFRGQILSPDGRRSLAATNIGKLHQAAEVGERTALDLIRHGAERLLAGSA